MVVSESTQASEESLLAKIRATQSAVGVVIRNPVVISVLEAVWLG